MSLKRYGNQRDANEPAIVRALETIGCSVVRLDTPCDLLVGRHGRTFLLEVKSEKGKLTGDQVEFSETWRGHFKVVRSMDDAIAAVWGVAK